MKAKNILQEIVKERKTFCSTRIPLIEKKAVISDNQKVAQTLSNFFEAAVNDTFVAIATENMKTIQVMLLLLKGLVLMTALNVQQ